MQTITKEDNIGVAMGRLGGVVKGLSTDIPTLNTTLLMLHAPEALIRDVIGVSDYNKYVDTLPYCSGEDDRDIHIYMDISNMRVRLFEKEVGRYGRYSMGMFSLFQEMHAPLLQSAQYSLNDFGNGKDGNALYLVVHDKRIPLNHLKIDMTKGGEIITRKAVVEGGKTILPMGSVLMKEREMVPGYQVVDSQGWALGEDSLSKLFWLHIGSQGIHSRDQDSLITEAFREYGYGGLSGANDRLMELMTDLQENHGYDPMVPFKRLLVKTESRLGKPDHIETLSKACMLARALHAVDKAKPVLCHANYESFDNAARTFGMHVSDVPEFQPTVDAIATAYKRATSMAALAASVRVRLAKEEFGDRPLRSDIFRAFREMDRFYEIQKRILEEANDINLIIDPERGKRFVSDLIELQSLRTDFEKYDDYTNADAKHHAKLNSIVSTIDAIRPASEQFCALQATEPPPIPYTPAPQLERKWAECEADTRTWGR